jgi:hypothetical protein
MPVEAPIFIGGPHRSGTGMLRALLGANSAIAIPPREYLFFEIVGAILREPLADSFQRADVALKEQLLQSVLRSPKVQLWGITEADVSSFSPMRSLQDFYAAPLLAYAQHVKKGRFGEKTPFLERNFPQLLTWFGPSTRFVHILRDPYETYLSARRYEHFLHPPSAGDFAWRWKLSLVTGLHYSRTFPRNYTVIRYGDFVRDPAHATELLCEFCNLPNETDAMLGALEEERMRNSSFSRVPQTPRQNTPRLNEEERSLPYLPEETRGILDQKLHSCLKLFTSHTS